MGLRALLACFLSVTLGASALAAAPPQTTRTVMTWVAPYAVAGTQVKLKTLFGTYGPRNSLTHVGLQSWTASATGGLARAARYGAVTNAKIQEFVAWGNVNNVKTLLCVYNGEWGWDWALARNAFGPNRTKFINALVAEMQLRNLDGIDVDLEGIGNLEADKATYLAFIRALAAAVHARGKVLTVDTFPYIWNAPNSNWWVSIFPHVESINSMGYEDLGRAASPETWRTYAWQRNAAAGNHRKLNIGMPSYLNTWRGHTANQQIDWFFLANAGDTGIAIWDGQLTATTWQSSPLWTRLNRIRTDRIAAP